MVFLLIETFLFLTLFLFFIFLVIFRSRRARFEQQEELAMKTFILDFLIDRKTILPKLNKYSGPTLKRLIHETFVVTLAPERKQLVKLYKKMGFYKEDLKAITSRQWGTRLIGAANLNRIATADAKLIVAKLKNDKHSKVRAYYDLA